MTPHEFEKATGLSGYDCAILIGCSSSKWYEWGTGKRPLPRYILASMEAHLALYRSGMLVPLLERRKAARRVRRPG